MHTHAHTHTHTHTHTGNYHLLHPPLQQTEEVKEKQEEFPLHLSSDCLGLFMGRGGKHIKPLCKEYNVKVVDMRLTSIRFRQHICCTLLCRWNVNGLLRFICNSPCKACIALQGLQSLVYSAVPNFKLLKTNEAAEVLFTGKPVLFIKVLALVYMCAYIAGPPRRRDWPVRTLYNWVHSEGDSELSGRLC